MNVVGAALSTTQPRRQHGFTSRRCFPAPAALPNESNAARRAGVLSRSCSGRYPGLLRADDEAKNTILWKFRKFVRGKKWEREIQGHTTGRPQASSSILTGRRAETHRSSRTTRRELYCHSLQQSVRIFTIKAPLRGK